MSSNPVLDEQLQQRPQNEPLQNQHPSSSAISRPWESTYRKNINLMIHESDRLATPFVSFLPHPSSTWYRQSSAFALPSYCWDSPYSPLLMGEAPASNTKEFESRHHSPRVSTSDQSSRLISSTRSTPCPGPHSRRVGRRLFSPAITDRLNSWFRSHVQHPYPSEEDLHQLSADCGGSLTNRQILKWISNKRDRTRNTRPHNHCPHPRSVKRQQRLMSGPAGGGGNESGAASSASSAETDAGVASEVEANSTIDSSSCDNDLM